LGGTINYANQAITWVASHFVNFSESGEFALGSPLVGLCHLSGGSDMQCKNIYQFA